MWNFARDLFASFCFAFRRNLYAVKWSYITNENLRRAEGILSKFFQTFCNLYPQGNCGLNVHNIGFHYVDYVQLLGPLWAWSCFPFEDCNSMITKSVHGTGNITHQVMRLKEAQTVLRNNLQLTLKERLWKCTKCMLNCEVAGALRKIPNDAYESFIMRSFCAEDTSEIKKSRKNSSPWQKVLFSKLFSYEEENMQCLYNEKQKTCCCALFCFTFKNWTCICSCSTNATERVWYFECWETFCKCEYWPNLWIDSSWRTWRKKIYGMLMSKMTLSQISSLLGCQILMDMPFSNKSSGSHFLLL